MCLSEKAVKQLISVQRSKDSSAYWGVDKHSSPSPLFHSVSVGISIQPGIALSGAAFVAAAA